MSRILPLLLATLAATACAGRELAPDERVIHVRELVARSADGAAVAVLEVADTDGAPARATLVRWAADRREVLATAPAETARAAAARAERGLPPSGAWEDGLRAALGADWVAPGPAADGPPWRPPGLPDAALAPRRDDDPRYGPAVRLVLRDAGGHEDEVARFPGREPPAIELRFLGGNAAVAALRPPPSPGAVVADVVLLDLGPPAGRLLAAEADRLAAAGDVAAARDRLDRARALAPGEPTIPYRAAVLAATGGDRDGALAALARAIALDPSLYRMLARTDPALAALRGDPSFEALVRPRPLP
jgi:tetratricopeptide (TPR) repeat protein